MTFASPRSPGQSDAVPRARWWRVGILLFLIYLVCFADRANISIALPAMVENLELSGTVAGTVLSAFFWGYVITQVPGGYLATRIGPKQVIIVALVVVGLTACATGFAPNLSTLLAVRAVMGLAEGAIFPAFAVMFVRWFPGSERGRAVALTQYATPVSSALMAPLGGWMIDLWNYHTMFVVQGLPAFVLAAVFAAAVPNDPAQDHRLHEAERDLILAERDQETQPEAGLVKALVRPVVAGLCVVYFLWITGLYSFSLWLPSVIDEFSDTNISAVGWLTALPFAVAVVAMYATSRFSDRAAFSRGWVVAASLALAGVALLVQKLLGDVGPTPKMVLLCVIGIGLYSSLGTWWTWVISQVPRNQAGPAVGLVNLCGNVGGVAGPILVGWAAAGGSLTPGLVMLGFVLVAAAGLSSFIAGRGYDGQSQEADAAWAAHKSGKSQ